LAQPSWLLVLPALLAYLVIVIYPTLRDGVEAFTNWSGIGFAQKFIGFTNFVTIGQDTELRSALWHTAVIAVVVTVVQNGLGLLVALALHQRLKTRLVLRALFFLPVVFNPIVIAYTWQFIYDNGGSLDTVLQAVGLGSLQRDWLGSPDLALWSVLVAMIWQYVGYSMVIFLAGLEGIPKEVNEAAVLDGAGSVPRFRYVTWPLLAPALTINAALTMIGGLNAFTVVFAMTGGGPGNATQTVTTVLFQDAFTFGRYGYGTAIALCLSVLVTVVALVQLKVLRRRELVA
jgi:raffinose/stachyose/melibiose transport system permease protein